jgi:tetratricopeptide (TPR) repeat protein
MADSQPGAETPQPGTNGPAAPPRTAEVRPEAVADTISERPSQERRQSEPPVSATAVADRPEKGRNEPGQGQSEEPPQSASSNGAESAGGKPDDVPPEQGLRELTDSLEPSTLAADSAQDDVEMHLGEARQHLGNDAIRNALDSLENALELNPDHPEALHLTGEAKQLERAQQAREEQQVQKEWHYQKAREAWEDGDLEATLEELERLSALEYEQPGESERSGIYREFQKQVHAENEALSSSYAEARALVAEENLGAAQAICERYLAKYPSHALFQALRFDIGERRRQEALALIADTDRRVEAEPALDRKIEILQHALDQSPGEKHFEEAIRLVREKQTLIRSVLEKAKSLEQSQRFREALEQWQLVASIHAEHPGLAGNLERLEQRAQENRMQKEAQSRWVSQAKRCLQAGDYEQALELVRNALVECPDDAELRDLELEAGQGLQRAGSVRDHLRQAQQHWHAGRRCEGLDELRQAQKLDPRNTLVRGELVNALVEFARLQVETDWASAQPMIEEILRLEPNHTTAVHLLEQIGRQKREETVSWCLVEARRLRAGGDAETAYRLVSEHLRQYPDEDRLLQFRESLAPQIDPSSGLFDEEPEPQSEHDEYEPDAQSGDAGDALFEGWDEGQQSYGGGGAEARDDAAYRAEDFPGAGYAGSADPEGAAGRGELYTGMNSGEVLDASFEPAAGDETGEGCGPGEPASLFDSSDSLFGEDQDSPDRPTTGSAAPRQVQPAEGDEQDDLLSRLASDSTHPPAGKGRAKPAPAAKASPFAPLQQKYAALAQQLRRRLAGKNFEAVGRSWPVVPTLLGVAAAFLLVAVLAIALISRLADNPPATPIAQGLAVTIESSPSGAALSVDGEACAAPCQLELSAGSHRVEARLAGFRPALAVFDVDEASAAQPIVVTLSPFAPTLLLSSDLDSGKLTLDDQPVGELEDGGLEQDLTDLAEGEHTLRLAGAGLSVTIPFEIPAGAAPRLTGPLTVNSLKAVVVAGLGATAHVYGTEPGQAVNLDGQPQGKLGAEPLVLQNLSEGTHELMIGSGREQRRIVFDSGDAPLLAAYLNSDRNVGSLRVITGEDDVQIFLNGTPYRRKTARGRRLIYLFPNKFEVRVEKDGFQSLPPQIAEIRKGEEVQLEFTMAPLPRVASLRISNAVPGTEVWVDGESRGVVRSSVFTLSNLEPGRHRVRLEHEDYKTAEFEREVGANAVFELDGALESAVGTLEIQVLPADADVRLTLQREGETRPRPIAERTLNLPPGTYTVQASAGGFENFSATVRLGVGQTKVASLTLRPEEKKPEQPALTLADWQKTGWQREGNLLIRRGGDYVVAPGSGGAGRYTFTALLQKGRRLEWVVNYSDRDNHVFYQLGDDYLHRTEVTKGHKSRTVKIPHKMKWGGFLSVDISVQQDAIVHRVLVDDKWIELDNWKSAAGNLTVGKFGFHIPGRDQVGLSHFAFMPDR